MKCYNQSLLRLLKVYIKDCSQEDLGHKNSSKKQMNISVMHLAKHLAMLTCVVFT